jgi:flavin reductase (DIM6/NTAB) family NADH-FMN oxidoreductase RutF
MKIQAINVKELQTNVFEILHDRWMLITAGNPDKFNTMTASWGTFGILWNKPVAICFIRPQRYTFEFIETQDLFTLSFFPAQYKHVLNYCGSHSGKDNDKIKETNLTPIFSPQGGIYFEEANLVFECQKMYTDMLKPDNFLQKDLIDKFYPQSDFHKFFIGEITNCFATHEFINKQA